MVQNLYLCLNTLQQCINAYSVESLYIIRKAKTKANVAKHVADVRWAIDQILKALEVIMTIHSLGRSAESRNSQLSRETKDTKSCSPVLNLEAQIAAAERPEELAEYAELFFPRSIRLPLPGPRWQRPESLLLNEEEEVMDENEAIADAELKELVVGLADIRSESLKSEAVMRELNHSLASFYSTKDTSSFNTTVRRMSVATIPTPPRRKSVINEGSIKSGNTRVVKGLSIGAQTSDPTIQFQNPSYSSSNKRSSGRSIEALDHFPIQPIRSRLSQSVSDASLAPKCSADEDGLTTPIRLRSRSPSPTANRFNGGYNIEEYPPPPLSVQMHSGGEDLISPSMKPRQFSVEDNDGVSIRDRSGSERSTTISSPNTPSADNSPFLNTLTTTPAAEAFTPSMYLELRKFSAVDTADILTAYYDAVGIEELCQEEEDTLPTDSELEADVAQVSRYSTLSTGSDKFKHAEYVTIEKIMPLKIARTNSTLLPHAKSHNVESEIDTADVVEYDGQHWDFAL